MQQKGLIGDYSHMRRGWELSGRSNGQEFFKAEERQQTQMQNPKWVDPTQDKYKENYT